MIGIYIVPTYGIPISNSILKSDLKKIIVNQLLALKIFQKYLCVQSSSNSRLKKFKKNHVISLFEPIKIARIHSESGKLFP